MIEGIENAFPNYGLPKKKKYPLPDRKHVLSAIRFFNYVSPQDEKQLAEAILEKIKEYGMKDVGVGPDNRFLKYYKKDTDYLEHHGILGQKWGVRRFQNEDGTLTPAGRARVAKTVGYGYLNPKHKFSYKKEGRNTWSVYEKDRDYRKIAERDKVSKAYDSDFWDAVAKGMTTSVPTKEGRALWEKYKDAYAGATLKDLKMRDTSEGREAVKRILSEVDKYYDYDRKIARDNGRD